MQTVLSLVPCLLLAGLPANTLAADGEDWLQYHGGPTHNNMRKAKLAIESPSVAWHVKDAHGQPTLAGGELYSGGKALFRIDAATGAVLASVGASPEGEEPAAFYAAAPALAEDRVIARKGTMVEAWDRALGELKWSWTPPGGSKAGYRHPGVLVDGAFVFADGGDMVALAVLDGNLLWTYAFGAEINMVPAADQGRVFVGTRAGDFMALDLLTGTEVWNYGGDAQFGHTSPVIVNGIVVVGDRGTGERRGAINAFDAKTGQLEWQTGFGATGFSTPGVTSNAVLAGFGKTVGFFNLKNGERESKPRISCGTNAFGSPTIIGKHLVYGNLDGNLYVHDAKRGKLAWQFRLSEGQVGDFIYANQRLFVSTTQGLFALEDGKSRATKGNVLTWTAE